MERLEQLIQQLKTAAEQVETADRQALAARTHRDNLIREVQAATETSLVKVSKRQIGMIAGFSKHTATNQVTRRLTEGG